MSNALRGHFLTDTNLETALQSVVLHPAHIVHSYHRACESQLKQNIAMFTLRTYCIYAGSKRVAIGLGSLVLLDCVLKVVSSSLHVEKINVDERL